MYKKCIIILLLIANVLADLPTDFADKEDIKAAVKAKCEQNGGPEAFENLNRARQQFQDCIQGLINETVFRNELEAAKKTGSMDEVFGHYCGKTPEVKNCVKDFTTVLDICLEETEKNALNVTMNVVKKVGEFLCQHDGDRLAMFIAEGGVECWNSQVEAVKGCVNDTFSENLPTSISLNSLPSITINEEKCDNIKSLQKCVVDVLEKCENSTPANLIDALFKFVHRNVCKNRSRRALFMDNDDSKSSSQENTE